ncbi:MAG: hypothetical protein ABI968_03315 [Acidobacteriota bacterium]
MSSRRAILFTGAGAALAIRVSFLLSHRGNFDTAVYQRIVALVESGANLYSDSNEYKWSPVWGFLLWIIHGAGGALGLPLHRAVGFFLLGVDAVTAYLVYRLARRIGNRGESGALSAAVLFFANPVSVFASSFNLQWDSLSILFLLAALLFALPPHDRKTPFVAGLSASMLVKHISWFHPILFFRNRTLPARWRWAALIPYAVFLVSFLPYWRAGNGIRENVFGYRGGHERYGVGVLMEMGWLAGWQATLLFLLAVGLAILAFRNLEPVRASLLLFLVMLLFTPGIQQYYFVWPIALGSVFGGFGTRPTPSWPPPF